MSAPIFSYLSLTYHGISKSANGSWEMTPNAFRDDIRLLKSLGYNFLTFNDLECRVIPKNSVFITFDDGLFSFYNFALDSPR